MYFSKRDKKYVRHKQLSTFKEEFMELFHLSTEVTLENNTTESARPSLDLLNELELCMVGGGMGDVLQ